MTPDEWRERLVEKLEGYDNTDWGPLDFGCGVAVYLAALLREWDAHAPMAARFIDEDGAAHPTLACDACGSIASEPLDADGLCAARRRMMK